MSPKQLRAMQALSRQIVETVELADAAASAVDERDRPTLAEILAPGDLNRILHAANVLACLVLDRPTPERKRR
jgi:hypothetical protein